MHTKDVWVQGGQHENQDSKTERSNGKIAQKYILGPGGIAQKIGFVNFSYPKKNKRSNGKDKQKDALDPGGIAPELRFAFFHIWGI